MKLHARWILFAFALFIAPQAVAQGPSNSRAGFGSLLEMIDGAELIAVGTVVPRVGDPAELGAVRQALSIEVLLKGERPDGEVALMGNSIPVLEDSGKLIAFTSSDHGVSWTNGERLVTFLNPSRGHSHAWSGAWPGGRRSPFPGDVQLYAEKVRAAIELLAQPRTVEQRDALRAWAVSMLDHEATLADGVRVLLDSKQDRRGESRLGRLSPEQEAHVVQAAVRYHLGHGFDSTSRMLLQLTETIPARAIDSWLSYLVSGDSQLEPRQRAEYATMLAKRLDDEVLRDAAAKIEAHVALAIEVVDDPERRGPWEIKLQVLCEGFRVPASQAMSRAKSR